MSLNNQPAVPERAPIAITRAFLHGWQLPQPDQQGDKNARGSVLVVGGSSEMPGGAILAATAALRCGVGRLRIATCQGIASAVGAVVPEARVFQLPETRAGGIDPAAADQLANLANQARAVLIGPGMIDRAAIRELLERLLPQIEQPVLILDAGALTAGACEPHVLAARNGKLILTPHAGEMARMRGIDKAAVAADPLGVALRSAVDFGAVVVLKGPTTWVVDADKQAYRYQEGDVGLATSGSGDTLAGAIAGLAARAASPAQAAAWGVYLHGEAGNRLAQLLGRLGFLARELPGEFPQIIAAVEGQAVPLASS